MSIHGDTGKPYTILANEDIHVNIRKVQPKSSVYVKKKPTYLISQKYWYNDFFKICYQLYDKRNRKYQLYICMLRGILNKKFYEGVAEKEKHSRSSLPSFWEYLWRHNASKQRSDGCYCSHRVWWTTVRSTDAESDERQCLSIPCVIEVVSNLILTTV